MDIDLPTLDPAALDRLLAADVEIALRGLAGRLRVVAAELVVVSVVVRGCADLTWEGPSAALFEDRVAERASAVGSLEAEASRLAGALDSLAGTVAHRLNLLDAARTPVGILP